MLVGPCLGMVLSLFVFTNISTLLGVYCIVVLHNMQKKHLIWLTRTPECQFGVGYNIALLSNFLE